MGNKTADDERGGPTLVQAGAGIGVSVLGVGAASASDQWGPILAFVGVLLAAVVAWIAADRRQARQIASQERALAWQLSAEQERLTAQLEAESQRQEARLGHDRALADIHDLRVLLDAAAVLLDEASYAGAEARRMSRIRATDARSPKATQMSCGVQTRQDVP